MAMVQEPTPAQQFEPERERPWLPLSQPERGAGVDRDQAAARAAVAVRDLVDDQLLDQMVARVRADGGRLTGPGAF